MPLQILDHPWHQVHAYRLHALPAEFTHLLGVREWVWNKAQRPIPTNFRGGVLREHISPGFFDVALMHLDQWCDRKNLRALPYRVMSITAKDLGIPRLVIMHGTPDNEQNRQNILRLMGDLPVVCNSVQAAEEWDNGEERDDISGLPQFRAIIHGYRVDEFMNYSLEHRRHEIVSVCSGGSISAWYHGTPLLKRLMREIPIVWWGPLGTRKWASNYLQYRQTMAETLIYFSPTSRGPMPGARTEAMLSGCAVVSMQGNDIEQYLDGTNGLVADSFVGARGMLLDLLQEPERAWEMGQKGRETARQDFEHTRFVRDWLKVLESIGVHDGE